jgi:hypothetical protein
MRSLPAVITVAAALALALSGCVPGGTASPSTSASPSEPGGGPSSTASQAPGDPAGALPATPVTIDCNELVSLQAVYDFNPNYGNQPDFTPPAGSNAATIAASEGTVCNWVNQTSGENFIVAVAQPAPDQLAAVRSAAEAGTPASGIGDVAYFSSAGGVGEAQVFAGPYWLVAASSAFFDADTAKPLIDSALSALDR